MKKIVVLLAVAALFAAPAFGAVRNSKHDLSSSSTASIKSANVDEICVFCHTPHGGITGQLAPLWNRTASIGTPSNLYNSATLDQTNSRPGIVSAAVTNSDAPLCMSCHDGSSLAGGLANAPASNGNVQPNGAALTNVGTDANIFGGAAGLSNDHPIGMDYSAVEGADTSGPAGATAFIAANGTDTAVNGLPLYTSTGVMWCSTCHDVHNEGAGQPLLNVSNAGSALCTSCHIK